MKKVFVMLSMVLGSIAVVFGQKPAVVADNDPGWKRIGQVTASFKTTSESIVVLGADEFQAIKLKVKDAPVHIDRVQVFYESGDMEEVNVGSQLNAGAETRTINLKNPTRDIQKVAFTYKTVANSDGTKADVELYGLKTATQGDAYRHDKEKLENKADRKVDEVNRDAKESEHEVENAADRAGDKISEGAAKAAAEISDKRLDDKVGPDGQTIYMDTETKYYYINDEGKKVFVTKMQLKDKPDND